ncbi:MAG: DUF2061 domain-containing protein [Dongiaceae bacterium]
MVRTLTKTGTYSAMHMVVAIAVAWAISGDWRIALGIGLIEPLVQTVAYTIHERLWSRGGKTRIEAGHGHGHRQGGGHGLLGARTAP